MRVTKSDISLELECWVEELSPAQLAAYEKVANEHNAIKNALKSALTTNEGRELFNGQVFQAYSFKGKVLAELKEATLPPKKPAKVDPPAAPIASTRGGGRKRPSNFVYLESSDEEEDDVPLAKRIAVAAGKKGTTPAVGGATPNATKGLKGQKGAQPPPAVDKSSPSVGGKGAKAGAAGKGSSSGKGEKGAAAPSAPPANFKPSEITSVGGLVIGTDNKDGKDGKDQSKETKLQGKTFPSLVVLAKPWLKVKDMSSTRSKLDSKVKLVLMLTPNKFTEWLIQEGLLKAEQKCANHRSQELKLGVYSDATKFPYTGGYVWISECCPMRFVSVFHGSIFEGAPHPPSCILKLIYHWSCQTNIQNVVQWVKVDNVYIKGVYTWLRAICTLAVHQKCKKLGGPERFVEVGVISLGTTSQDGQQRQVKVEVLGVLDYAEKTIRLRAVEPVSDADRNYKKRFQTILEPLQRWVHKDSVICIDLTVDKMTLYSMGFKNIIQAAATDNSAKHTNAAVMDYLRRIVPRMFQNTLSLLSRQMIQQFLDELVWREQFGTYALQAFNNITAHIAEQTRMNTNETLTQRLYQVATNPFKDWSILPANYRETPANTTPKRLKKPINEADYGQPEKINLKSIKKEKPDTSKHDTSSSTSTPVTGRRGRHAAAPVENNHKPEPKKSTTKASSSTSKAPPPPTKGSAAKHHTASAKQEPSSSKKIIVEAKVKKEKDVDDDLKGLEELYYGIRNGLDINFESFPYKNASGVVVEAATVECPICDINDSFDSNEKLQTHLVSHIIVDKDHQFQCLFCLDKHPSETVLSKHNQIMHPLETKAASSASYHCLICQQRFNSLHHLTVHLQKMHNMLELPYVCQACNYRSSSHRDAVRHFYDDHKNQNFLQCPFCLDIFRFSYKGRISVSNIENYYMHLRAHIGKRDSQLRCQKCALSFTEKGALKQHSANQHISLLKSTQKIQPLLANSMLIAPPKIRSHHREPLPYTVVSKLGEFYAFIDGSICAECNSEILNEDHFSGILKCNKCNYKSCCERAVFEHAAECSGGSGAREVMELPLPNEMHCICGFSTSIGNKMAHHLATCGQKSAYVSVEAAQENTVKRNMLDMLGLVRRDGESGAEGEEQSGEPATTSNEAVTAAADATELQQSDAPQVSDSAAPIQFGEMEATPVLDSNSVQQEQSTGLDDTNVVEQQTTAAYSSHIVDSGDVQAAQYHIGFGQPEQQHALNTSDIDMPLIGELADPNPPITPQFIGEVHTPMFDAVAAAEQQHYHQMMQQQQHHHQQQQ
ncbi:uncharacterized protein LOC128868667 isoform X1 [Anastrepha ludens]|uniref:uncharacterized protein LOC128868667 isoform X1 n=1 Tax=Anastrepha ludens TaxID=28586 RepID=UPI0023B00F66|nr:uncharacterized protein LOC128868667 isoform X1 [Anastrepha ludens]